MHFIHSVLQSVILLRNRRRLLVCLSVFRQCTDRKLLLQLVIPKLSKHQVTIRELKDQMNDFNIITTRDKSNALSFLLSAILPATIPTSETFSSTYTWRQSFISLRVTRHRLQSAGKKIHKSCILLSINFAVIHFSFIQWVDNSSGLRFVRTRFDQLFRPEIYRNLQLRPSRQSSPVHRVNTTTIPSIHLTLAWVQFIKIIRDALPARHRHQHIHVI